MFIQIIFGNTLEEPMFFYNARSVRGIMINDPARSTDLAFAIVAIATCMHKH